MSVQKKANRIYGWQRHINSSLKLTRPIFYPVPQSTPSPTPPQTQFHPLKAASPFQSDTISADIPCSKYRSHAGNKNRMPLHRRLFPIIFWKGRCHPGCYEIICVGSDGINTLALNEMAVLVRQIKLGSEFGFFKGGEGRGNLAAQYFHDDRHGFRAYDQHHIFQTPHTRHHHQRLTESPFQFSLKSLYSMLIHHQCFPLLLQHLEESIYFRHALYSLF